MNISGINSLIYYKLDQKRILLLGEAHSTEGWCESTNTIKITEYVKELTEQIPEGECLDILFEGAYKVAKHSPNWVSGFPQTIKMLESFPKSDNLRIHHTDTRLIPNDESYFDEYLDYFPSTPNAFDAVETKFRKLMTKNDLLGVLDYFLTIDTKKNRKYFLKMIKSFQLLGLVKHNVSSSWEKSYFEIMNKELNKLDKSIMTKEILVNNLKIVYSNIITAPTEEEKQFYGHEYGRILVALVKAPMDMYTLARLFVKFDENPGIICNDKSTIQNVIIHSGSAHTIVYEHFLNITFGTRPELRYFTEFMSNMCLPISEEFDFWS